MLSKRKIIPVDSITGVINANGNDVNCINKGLDTIYFTVGIDAEIHDMLIKLIDNNDYVELLNFKFNVGLIGGVYSYNLSNKYLRIQITKNFIKEMPCMKILINSYYLHTENLLNILKLIKNYFGMFEIKTNRIDIFSDFQNLELNKDIKRNYNNFITRAKKWNTSDNKNEAESLTIGKRKSTVYLRIYNKTIELRENKKDKNWLNDIWKQNKKYKKTKKVTRIEYELKRKFLKQINLKNIDDLINFDLTKLWEYLTEWFRVIDRKSNKDKMKCKNTKKWEQVKKAFGENKENKLKREYPEINGNCLESRLKNILVKLASYRDEKPNETIIKIIRDININQYSKYDDLYHKYSIERDVERFNDKKFYYVPF